MYISSSEAMTNTTLSYLYGVLSELSDKVSNMYNDSGRKLRKYLCGGST